MVGIHAGGDVGVQVVAGKARCVAVDLLMVGLGGHDFLHYWGFNSELALLLLTFQHRAGVSPYTSSFDLAETCVFDKQLPGPIHCGSLSRAPLFPKLRGQFAEFLNNSSPVGLRILFLPTCVGLRYGRLAYSPDFSRLHPCILKTQLSLPLRQGQPTPWICTSRVSSGLNASAATEYQPYVHRLRLSASP